MPNRSSATPTTTRSASPATCATSTGPSTTASAPHATVAAPAPASAALVRRVSATASTIAIASKSSSATASAAPTAVSTKVTRASMEGAGGLSVHRTAEALHPASTRPIIASLASPALRAFAPAAALMARLTYARKFVLIGLVLLAPAALALHAYWSQQGGQIAFSAKERVGVVELRPANELVVRLVAARSLAVRAATGDGAAAVAVPAAAASLRSHHS